MAAGATCGSLAAVSSTCRASVHRFASTAPYPWRVDDRSWLEASGKGRVKIRSHIAAAKHRDDLRARELTRVRSIGPGVCVAGSGDESNLRGVSQVSSVTIRTREARVGHEALR